MTDFDMQRIMARDAKWAEQQIVSTGRLNPMAVIHKTDGNAVVLLLAVGPEDAYRVLALAAVAFDALAIAMISEAWMAAVPPDDDLARGASERDNREEVVVTAIVCRPADGRIEQATECRPIERGDNGRVTGLGPPRRGVDVRMRFAAALPKTRPSYREREQAMDVFRAIGLKAIPVHPEAGHA